MSYIPRLRPAIITALSLSFSALPLTAAITLAPLFRDGAVLQQGRPVPVWGTADAGETISVNFSGQTLNTTAGADGRWRVDLAPLPINAAPAELIATGTNTVRVRDVLVGEVWLCSGQSNMERTFKQLQISPPPAPGINDPLLRHFATRNTSSPTPKDTVSGNWAPSSEANSPNFSAVAYYFGQALRDQLHIPVGLINASWGGTQIESWMSPPSINALPIAGSINDRWGKILAAYPNAKAAYNTKLAQWTAARKAALAAGKDFTKPKPRRPAGEGHQLQPSSIYHGMINPLIPAAFRGVIWYQGETNAPRFSEYRQLFPAMITQWRQNFGQPAMPFYFVQLANLGRTSTPARQWAFQREAQTTALKLPATGMAVTIDIGDANDIHPKNKHDVGRRLALLALAEVYHQDVAPYGPRFDHIESTGNALRIHFTRTDDLVAPASGLTGFEIAGADQIFHDATAKIDGPTVIVTSDQVAHPVAVRHAFVNNPNLTLRNAAGLPAEPFRSDDW